MTALAETVCALLAREAGQPGYLDTLRQVGLFVDAEKARVWSEMPLMLGCGRADRTPYPEVDGDG